MRVIVTQSGVEWEGVFYPKVVTATFPNSVNFSDIFKDMEPLCYQTYWALKLVAFELSRIEKIIT